MEEKDLIELQQNIKDDEILVLDERGNTQTIKIEPSIKDLFLSLFEGGPLPNNIEARTAIAKIEACKTIEILEKTIIDRANNDQPIHLLVSTVATIRSKYNLSESFLDMINS